MSGYGHDRGLFLDSVVNKNNAYLKNDQVGNQNIQRNALSGPQKIVNMNNCKHGNIGNRKTLVIREKWKNIGKNVIKRTKTNAMKTSGEVVIH